jgi:hypothetical protein
MSSVIVAGDTSGSVTLQAPAVSGSTVLTLPTTTGTLVVNSGAQTIEFADGSASAPSITNSGDTNTGMFFPAADTIAFAEGGAEAMRIDSSGNVGIGTASPNVSGQAANIRIATVQGVSGSWGGLELSNTSGSFGTLLGFVGFTTTGSSAGYTMPAYIGTWLDDSGTAAKAGGSLRFFTQSDNTAGAAERMRINSNGNIALQGGTTTATGTGITFPATQSASSNANCLDDYEEGTWTPAFTSTGATFAYSTQTGYYTKIGNSVILSAYVNVSTKSGTLTNSVSITGLPFASKSGASASGVFGVEQFTVRPTLFSDTVSSTALVVYQAGSVTPMTPALMTVGAGFYLYTITYFTA